MSSNNGLNIAPLLDQYTPQHLVVKLYQQVELGGGGWKYSVAHATQARDKGVTVSGYGWLYAGIDGAKQVSDFLETATKAGINLGDRNPLWLDLETYTDGSYPSLATLSQAVAECERRGMAVGIYTGQWFWTGYLGNSTQFSHLPLWDAHYGIPPSLDTPGYGNWQARAGHQYQGSPVDRSIFAAEFASP